MPPRAFLADRIVEVDADKRLVLFTPVRWPVVLVVPGLISTPIALFWVQSGGVYELHKLGWVFALGYSVIAVVMTVMFLSPANRHVEVDLANHRLTIRKPYGRGVDLDAPLENVDVAYSESETRTRGTVVYTGKLTATSATRTYAIAHLSGKGGTASTSHWENIDIARQLAVLVRAAKAGDDTDLRPLQAAVAAKGHRAVLRSVGVLVMMVSLGLAYAYAAATGGG